MCEVNADGQDGQAPIQEDDALEKIFSECDGPSTGKVSVAKLMDYMYNQMSAHGSPKILHDLRESMCAISYNGEVTRQQYYDVSRSWLAKIRKGQHHHENHQDGNNNLRIDESSRVTSQLNVCGDDATVSPESGPDSAPTLHGFLELSTSTVADTTRGRKNEDSLFGNLSSVSGNCYLSLAPDDPVFDTTRDLQLRVQRSTVENDHLKEELQRSEDSIALLEKQLAMTRRKLELANEKCHRMQMEDEEHHAELSKTERDRQALRARNQHLEMENFRLRRELDDVVMETERLRLELDKSNEQKEERAKLLDHYRQELQEVQKMYEGAKQHLSQMDVANCQLKDENQVSMKTIEHLKTIVKELENRVSKLHMYRDDMSHDEQLSATPISENELGCDMDTSHHSGIIIPRSLSEEMKASGLGDPDINLTNEIETLDEKVDEQNITERYSVIRDAVKQLQRVLARVTVAGNKDGARTVPARNSPRVFGEIAAAGNEECRFSIEELRMLESEIRRTLSILPITVSHNVFNPITSKTDAATQVDILEPDSTPVCDIRREIYTGFMNHDFSASWGTEKHRHKETEKRVASLAEVKGSDSYAAASTPRSSPLPCSSRRSSSLGVCEEAIIEPIVAALNEIIQSSGYGNEDSDLAHSPTRSLREHNFRYIQTPASRRLFECDDSQISHDVEFPPSLLTPDAGSKISNTSVTGRSESGSGSNRGVFETYAWRCQGPDITDDSSDDKENSLRYIKGKGLIVIPPVDLTSHRTDSREPSPPTINREDATPGTYRAELTLASIQHSTVASVETSRSEDNGCDVLEDLNVDLKKLNLRSTSRKERHPMERNLAEDFQPYDDVPKRKSSVYCQFIDPGMLDAVRYTSVRRSTSSFRVRKYTHSNQGTKRNKLLSRPSKKLAESLKISDSDSFGKNFCRTEPEGIDNIRPFFSTPIGHQVSTGRKDEILTMSESDDGDRVKSAPAVMVPAETRCNVSPTISQSGGFTFDSAQFNRTDDSHARMDFTLGTTEFPIEALAVNICKMVEPPHNEDVSESSGSSYVAIAGVDVPMVGSGRVFFGSERQQSRRVLEPMLPGKPCNKSEASLESCRTKNVIMDAQSFQQQAPTFCPSNHEIPGDVALTNVEPGRSDDCEISHRSRSVERAMSSEEDSSDSECARDQIRCEDNVQVVVPQQPTPPSQSTSPTSLLSQIQPHQPPQSESASSHPCSRNVISAFSFQEPPPYSRDRMENRVTEESEENRKRRLKKTERWRRSLSEGENNACHESFQCRCSCGYSVAQSRILGTQGGTGDTLEDWEHQLSLRAFPNLPDARLIELGLSEPPYGHELCERISEDELERKYTALSIGLGTDRATLLRRLALSLQQRDQAERNLTTEVGRMQRDIQALAPLCVDRESVERVERVRHQLEMISRCALRVSCTAELLGATHQERRVSRASLLADRYLQALRARCEKLAAELAETKRILIDNNIVVEENPSELIDDGVARVRYRGIPPASRTATVSRRRASIATISRPSTVNSLQEALTKATPHHMYSSESDSLHSVPDNARQQRVSISGRMTLRRPSLSYDTQRWDEKLDRTDSSSSSIGELREIFEQAESRRGSKEENNNLIHRQLNNFGVASCESGDFDTFTSNRRDSTNCQAPVRDEELITEYTSPRQRVPRVFGMLSDQVSRLPVLWYILFLAIFFFGFYSNRYVSTRYMAPLKWWSIEEIFQRYGYVRRNLPPPL